MRVILFDPRFAWKVAKGAKRQTIREKALCKPGDRLSLRRWSGTPRRRGSGHVVLGEGLCTEVLPVSIGHGDWESGLRVGDAEMSVHDLPAAEQERMVARRLAFAQADGFLSFPELLDFFRNRLPFEGVVIRWEPAENVERGTSNVEL